MLGLILLSTLLPGEPPPPTTFPVETEVVQVQVLVTDSKGRPVPDLVSSDFTLYEDGKAVPIVAFRAPTGAHVLPAAPARPPSSGSTPPPTLSPEPVTFVAYVDNGNLTPQGRRRALPGLASFLKDQLARGGARVLVVAAGTDAHVLSPLTTDAEKVAAALLAAEREPTRGQLRRAEERHAIDTVKALLESGVAGCSDLTALQAPIRAQAGSRSQDLERTLARLEAVIQALGTVPGPKALFYVSDGLEQRPALDLFHQIGDICPQAFQSDFSTLLAPMQEYDLSRAFQALAARANASRVTLHPVDGSGLSDFSLTDLSQGSRRFVASPKTDAIRVTNLRAGQSILADETGGAAVFDANDPRQALADIADQMRGAYTLGLAPGHAPEGRVHRVRVELRRKGRLRFAPSYFHGVRAETGVSRTLAALLAGLEEDTLGATISVDAGPAGDAGTEHSRTVNVRISVPLARLSTVEEAGPRHGRLRVVIAIWRTGALARERPLEVREEFIDVPWLAADTPAASSPERRELVVKVPLGDGPREIGVGVHDAFSPLITYRRVRIESDD